MTDKPKSVTIPRVCPMIDLVKSIATVGDSSNGWDKEGLDNVLDRIKSATEQLRQELIIKEEEAERYKRYYIDNEL